KLVKSFAQDGDGVNAIASLPHGNIVVGGTCYDSKIRIFNSETGESIKSFSQYGNGVNAIAVLPNETIAVGGACDYATIRIYNTETGKLTVSISQQGEGITSSEEVIDILNKHQHSSLTCK